MAAKSNREMYALVCLAQHTRSLPAGVGGVLAALQSAGRCAAVDLCILRQFPLSKVPRGAVFARKGGGVCAREGFAVPCISVRVHVIAVVRRTRVCRIVELVTDEMSLHVTRVARWLCTHVGRCGRLCHPPCFSFLYFMRKSAHSSSPHTFFFFL